MITVAKVKHWDETTATRCFSHWQGERPYLVESSDEDECRVYLQDQSTQAGDTVIYHLLHRFSKLKGMFRAKGCCLIELDRPTPTYVLVSHQVVCFQHTVPIETFDSITMTDQEYVYPFARDTQGHHLLLWTISNVFVQVQHVPTYTKSPFHYWAVQSTKMTGLRLDDRWFQSLVLNPNPARDVTCFNQIYEKAQDHTVWVSDKDHWEPLTLEKYIEIQTNWRSKTFCSPVAIIVLHQFY